MPDVARGVASASDSGSTSSRPAANIRSAGCQPNASISTRASGENRNCPNEPAAVPAPSASERHASGTSLPNAESTRLNEQPGEPEADQDAGRKIERQRVGGVGHDGEAEPIHDGAGAQHPHGAEAVRDRARERLPHAPQQVLDGERHREHVPAPAIGERQRGEELAGRRARPEREHADQAAAEDDDGRGTPGFDDRGRREGLGLGGAHHDSPGTGAPT